MGNLLKNQGKLDEAKSYYKEALKGFNQQAKYKLLQI